MQFEFVWLHLLILALTAVVVVIADIEAVQYIRGKKVLLDEKRIELLHRIVWWGLAGMIVTGVLLVAHDLARLENPMFYVKQLMVVALVANGFVIGALAKKAYTTPFAQLSHKDKVPLIISGIVSVSCWIGATGMSFFVL